METKTAVLTTTANDAKDGLVSMSTPADARNMTLCTAEEMEPTDWNQGGSPTPSGGALAGPLYQFHGFRVLDPDDQPVGIVDWIWSEDGDGRHHFIGVQLRWLRGTARAVPADGVRIDRENSTIRVAYRKEQIKRAPRFAINRVLTAEQGSRVRSHYRRSETTVLCPLSEDLAA
jgi:hypothetical protein